MPGSKAGGDSGPRSDDTARYRRARMAITGVHPDKHPKANTFEVAVRTKIFCELWTEIEKIEGR